MAAIAFLLVAMAMFGVATVLALFAGSCEGDCPSGGEVVARYSAPAVLAFFPLWAAVACFIRWRLGTRASTTPASAGIAALLVLYPFIAVGLTKPLALQGDTQWAIFGALGIDVGR